MRTEPDIGTCDFRLKGAESGIYRIKSFTDICKVMVNLPHGTHEKNQDIHNRITGQPEQYSTARTGSRNRQPEQNSHSRTARAGRPGQDCQELCCGSNIFFSSGFGFKVMFSFGSESRFGFLTYITNFSFFCVSRIYYTYKSSFLTKRIFV
jgi:hypothetical protein